MQFEVCVDNIKSVEIATKAEVDRLELCSALYLGGITPSYAFLKQAIKFSTVSHHVMIRPRAGDFIFDQSEIDIMIDDILMSKELGADGVVLGALTVNREIDMATCQKLVEAARGMTVTFHRAFDLCKNPEKTLEQIIELGGDRLLTSGLEKTAWLGRIQIARLIEKANGRIDIMPGAGVTSKNALEIIETTGAKDIHFSAKGIRKNKMQSFDVSMGSSSEWDNQVIQADFDEIQRIKQQLTGFRE